MRVLNNTLLLRVNATRPKIYRWEISRLDFPRLDFLRDNNLFDITCAFLILNRANRGIDRSNETCYRWIIIMI